MQWKENAKNFKIYEDLAPGIKRMIATWIRIIGILTLTACGLLVVGSSFVMRVTLTLSKSDPILITIVWFTLGNRILVKMVILINKEN